MAATIVEFEDVRKSTTVVEEIVRLEKRIFPKHESLSKSFYDELKKKNCGLLYMKIKNPDRIGQQKDEEEEIVGYVMYSWISSLCASITKLAVKECYRRRGYGEALLGAAIVKCRSRKIHRISLHVDPERSPALFLYRKLGFEVDEFVESYYSQDRNAYRMYLDFDYD